MLKKLQYFRFYLFSACSSRMYVMYLHQRQRYLCAVIHLLLQTAKKRFNFALQIRFTIKFKATLPLPTEFVAGFD